MSERAERLLPAHAKELEHRFGDAVLLVGCERTDVGDDDVAEVTIGTTGPDEPSPAAEAVSPPSTEAANDNHPVDPLPAIGTE